MKTLVLTREEVERVLTLEDCIEEVQRAQIEFSAGRVVMPVRLTLPIPSRSAVLLAMPAWMDDPPSLGMKAISSFPGNQSRGVPTILGAVLLFDPETGQLQAIMDGVHLTAVRTAAASAVATRALAREDAADLALVGAGVQARSHLEAMRAVRPIERVRVVAGTIESARRFADTERSLHPELEFKAVTSPQEACEGADLICTVSTAKSPVVSAPWLKPGCHINAVGSHSKDAREIDGATMRLARVVVDSREANLSECGDCIIPIDEGLFGPEHVADEIGEVLEGTKPGRSGPDQITIYQSCGLAVQDLAAARLTYEQAVKKSAGTWIEL